MMGQLIRSPIELSIGKDLILKDHCYAIRCPFYLLLKELMGRAHEMDVRFRLRLGRLGPQIDQLGNPIIVYRSAAAVARERVPWEKSVVNERRIMRAALKSQLQTFRRIPCSI